MDTLLIALGCLGISAIVIATYVFTVAARNFVSDQGRDGGVESDGSVGVSQGVDRRNGRAAGILFRMVSTAGGRAGRGGR